MPCATALRSRCVSGSARLSRITRSSSVSPPDTVNSTSLPVDRAMSRTARGSGPAIAASGSVRILIAVSFSSSSVRALAPRASTSPSGRSASVPSACASLRPSWMASPMTSSR